MKGSPLLPIFLIVVVDILGLTIIWPLLPFLAEHLGASPAVVGLLVAVYSACQLVSGPLLGRMSDTMGRKPLLIVSQIGTCIGFLILANAQALWLVFLSRMIDGATAGNLSLAQAYIADVTAPKDRAKSFAVIGIAFGIGFLVGPGISGLLFHHYGFAAPVYLAAALSFTSILATTFLLPANPPLPEGMSPEDAAQAPPPPAGRRLSLLAWGEYTKYFQRRELASLLSQFFCFMMAFSLFTSGFALFAERRFTWHGAPFTPREVGYVMAFSGLLGIVWQGGLVGRLVKRFGEVKLAAAGFLTAAFGYGLLAAAFHIPLLLVSAFFSSFGSGVLRPTLTSLITQQVNRTEQGSVLGLNQSLQSVSAIVAPMLAGLLIEHEFLASWAILIVVFNLAGLAIGRAVKVAAPVH